MRLLLALLLSLLLPVQTVGAPPTLPGEAEQEAIVGTPHTLAAARSDAGLRGKPSSELKLFSGGTKGLPAVHLTLEHELGSAATIALHFAAHRIRLIADFQPRAPPFREHV